MLISRKIRDIIITMNEVGKITQFKLYKKIKRLKEIVA